MKNNLVMTVMVALLVGAVGFFGGMQYQKSQNPMSLGPGQIGMRNQLGNRGGAGRMGGRAVVGEVISSDDKSITVKLPDGSSKIVIVSDSTQYNKAATASKTDIKTGERVAVFGTNNADGSVTAQNIQLNPNLRGGNQATPGASSSQ